jgi:hypothetical protein
MLITWNGTTATNQYLSPPSSHLVLSHPGLADSLLLSEHDEKPYEHYPTGWTQADGRSLLGAIVLKGDNWLKDSWECNFLVLAPQLDLFNQLLSRQQVSGSVTLVDRWIDGMTSTKLVWLPCTLASVVATLPYPT